MPFCFAAKSSTRLRVRRSNGHVEAVLYDGDGKEHVIVADDQENSGQNHWVNDEVPVVKYDGQVWKKSKTDFVSSLWERLCCTY